MPMPTPQQLASDPKFLALPDVEKIKVLQRIDTRFGALPPAEQQRVVRMRFQANPQPETTTPANLQVRPGNAGQEAMARLQRRADMGELTLAPSDGVHHAIVEELTNGESERPDTALGRSQPTGVLGSIKNYFKGAAEEFLPNPVEMFNTGVKNVSAAIDSFGNAANDIRTGIQTGHPVKGVVKAVGSAAPALIPGIETGGDVGNAQYQTAKKGVGVLQTIDRKDPVPTRLGKIFEGSGRIVAGAIPGAGPQVASAADEFIQGGDENGNMAHAVGRVGGVVAGTLANTTPTRSSGPAPIRVPGSFDDPGGRVLRTIEQTEGGKAGANRFRTTELARANAQVDQINAAEKVAREQELTKKRLDRVLSYTNEQADLAARHKAIADETKGILDDAFKGADARAASDPRVAGEAVSTALQARKGGYQALFGEVDRRLGEVEKGLGEEAGKKLADSLSGDDEFGFGEAPEDIKLPKGAVAGAGAAGAVAGEAKPNGAIRLENFHKAVAAALNDTETSRFLKKAQDATEGLAPGDEGYFAGALADEGGAQGPQRTMSKAYDSLKGMLKDFQDAEMSQTYKSAASSLSDLLESSRALEDALPGRRGRIVAQLTDALRKDIDQSITSLQESGKLDESTATALRAARDGWIDLHRPGVHDLMEVAQTAPERAFEVIYKPSTTLEDLATIKKQLTPEAWQSLASSAVAEKLRGLFDNSELKGKLTGEPTQYSRLNPTKGRQFLDASSPDRLKNAMLLPPGVEDALRAKIDEAAATKLPHEARLDAAPTLDKTPDMPHHKVYVPEKTVMGRIMAALDSPHAWMGIGGIGGTIHSGLKNLSVGSVAAGSAVGLMGFLGADLTLRGLAHVLTDPKRAKLISDYSNAVTRGSARTMMLEAQLLAAVRDAAQSQQNGQQSGRQSGQPNGQPGGPPRLTPPPAQPPARPLAPRK